MPGSMSGAGAGALKLIEEIRELKSQISELKENSTHIEVGQIKTAFSNSPRTYTITFKAPFKNVSVAISTSSGALSVDARARIKNVSATGFQIYTYSDDSTVANGCVYWIATERTDIE